MNNTKNVAEYMELYNLYMSDNFGEGFKTDHGKGCIYKISNSEDKDNDQELLYFIKNFKCSHEYKELGRVKSDKFKVKIGNVQLESRYLGEPGYDGEFRVYLNGYFFCNDKYPVKIKECCGDPLEILKKYFKNYDEIPSFNECVRLPGLENILEDKYLDDFRVNGINIYKFLYVFFSMVYYFDPKKY